MYNIYLKNIEELIEKRKETGITLESNYISSIIKNRRLELKMTLSEITENICSEAFLSKVERNLMSPYNDRVELLCERLDLDYHSLINLESNDRIEKLLQLFINNNYNDIMLLPDETIKDIFIAQDEIVKCYKFFIEKNIKQLHLSIIKLDNVKECLSNIELFALLLIIFETYFYTLQYHKALDYINLLEGLIINVDKYSLYLKERKFILCCKMELKNIKYLFEDIQKDFHYYSIEKQFSLLLHYYETLNSERAYQYIIDMGDKYVPEDLTEEYHYAKVLLLTKLNKNIEAMREIIDSNKIHIRFACLYAYNLLMVSYDLENELEIKKYKNNLVSYVKLCNQSICETYHIAFLRLMQYEIDGISPEIICNFIKNHLLKELKEFSYPLYDEFIKDRYCLLLGKLCRYKDAYLYLLEMKMHLKK